MIDRYRGGGGVVTGGMHLARRSLLPLLVAGVALFGACGSDDGGDDDVSTSTTLHIGSPSTLPAADPGISVSAEGFTGWQEHAADGCSEIGGRVVDPDGDGAIVLQLTATGCPAEEALNGSFGSYRTEADVAATTTEPLETPIGPGIAFTQTYTECTNSCTDFVQPVVLITLDAPVDAEHPTLTLIGVGDVTAEQVVELAESLQPA